MKIVCTKRRDSHLKDAQIVMIRHPMDDDEGVKRPKVVLKFELGEEYDLDLVCEENDLGIDGETLAHIIMGDKRFKGLFKVVGSKSLAPSSDTEKVSKKPGRPKKKVLNKSLHEYQNKGLEAEAV